MEAGLGLPLCTRQHSLISKFQISISTSSLFVKQMTNNVSKSLWYLFKGIKMKMQKSQKKFVYGRRENISSGPVIN